MSRDRFSTSSCEFDLPDHGATEALGERLGRLLSVGDVVAIRGPLGAGKTTFIQGLARGMGLRDQVTSPTFIICREHVGPPRFLHVDAYRIASGTELTEAIGEDLAAPDAVVAVEWAERVESALPSDRLDVTLAFAGEGRRAAIVPRGPRAAAVMERLQAP
ncbi:MAG: tRNA (adenosine(37)-N6)-threonylcarbamoyltransferase complex ATPase subunit type 1 TsaE [Armatimonadota bacterium]